MADSNSKRSWLSRWLNRLAEASDREWGNKPPECCAGMRSKIELCGNKSQRKVKD